MSGRWSRVRIGAEAAPTAQRKEPSNTPAVVMIMGGCIALLVSVLRNEAKLG